MNENNNDDKNLTQIRVENDKDITNKPEEGTKIKAKDGKTYMVAKEVEIGWFRSSIVAVEQDNFQNKVRLITGWSYYFWVSIATGATAAIGTGIALFAYFKKKNKPEQTDNNPPSNSGQNIAKPSQPNNPPLNSRQEEEKEADQKANNPPPPPPPMPTPPPMPEKQKKEKIPEKQAKKGGWEEIHEKIRKRRKGIEGED